MITRRGGSLFPENWKHLVESRKYSIINRECNEGGNDDVKTIVNSEYKDEA